METAQAKPMTETTANQVQIQRVPQEGEDWNGLPPDKDISRPVKIEPVFDSTGSKFLVDLTEKEWGFVKSQMGDKHDLSLTHDITNPEPHPFWQGRLGTVTLQPHTTFLDMTNPLDVIRLGVMRGHWLVANSLDEYKSGKWPEAMWIIVDNNQDIQEKATGVRKRAQAQMLLTELTDDALCDVLTVAKKKSFKGMTVANRLVEFEAAAIADPDSILRAAKLDREERELIAMVYHGISSHILTLRGATVYYADYALGIGAEGAIEFLQQVENEPLRAQIFDKIAKW